MVVVGDRKTHKPAVIPLLDLARTALRNTPRRVGSPFVFHNPSGHQLTASSLCYYWGKLRAYHAGRHGSEYAGLDFYEATKHCGATWMRNELGLDREQLRIMLGHTNYDYVDLYSHPDDVVMAQNVLVAVRQALKSRQ